MINAGRLCFFVVLCCGLLVVQSRTRSGSPQSVDSVRAAAFGLQLRLVNQISNAYKQEGVDSDVVFIIDDSGSISESDFKKGLNALTNLIDKINRNTKYAAIKFSNSAQLLFKFVSPYEAVKVLRSASYNGGMTNTQAALRMARTQLFQSYSSGVRQGSNRIAVVLTDGQSNIDKLETLPQARLLKEAAGVTVFVIAIGNYIPGIQEIYDIASENDEGEQLWFHLGNMKAFEQAIQLIVPNRNSFEIV